MKARSSIAEGTNLGDRLQRAEEAFVRASYLVVRPGVALAVTHLGTYGGVWLATAIVLLLTGTPEHVHLGRKVVAAIVLSIVLNIVVKLRIRRMRPAHRLNLVLHDRLIRPTSASFPSLHALESFACACILAGGMPRVALVAYGIASAIAVSRVVLAAHYPSDVIGGAFIGVVLGIGVERLPL